MFHSLPAIEPPVVHDPAWTAPPEAPLKMDFVMQQIQQQLLAGDQDMAVLVDTGDSMSRTQKVKLPGDTPYEVQVGNFAGALVHSCASMLSSCPLRHERKLSLLCSTPSFTCINISHTKSKPWVESTCVLRCLHADVCCQHRVGSSCRPGLLSGHQQAFACHGRGRGPADDIRQHR